MYLPLQSRLKAFCGSILPEICLTVSLRWYGRICPVFLFYQKRYDFIVQNIDLLARKAGYESESVIYLPISGWKGDNLVKRSENLNWFKMWQIERKSGGASGRTLLDAIDAMERPIKMDRFPLRLSVHSVYKLGGLCD